MISVFKYLKKRDWILLAVSVFLIVTQVAFELKMPDYTAKLTTIVQAGSTDMGAVWRNGGLMFLCAAVSLVAEIICAILISKVASSFSMTLRDRLFVKISEFSNAEMKKFSVPSLITRTTNDIMQMQNFMATGVHLIFKAPIMAIWAICKISTTNVEWTSAVIIGVVIIVVSMGTLVGLCLPRFKKIQKLTDDINNVTRENISGVRVVRAFNAEKYQEQKFEKVNNEITSNNLFTSRAMGFMSPIMTLVMNGLMLSIYWIGAMLVNNISLSGNPEGAILERISVVGNMAAFSQYAIQVIMSFMVLIFIFIILPRTIISGKRISEVLKTNPSIVGGKFDSQTQTKGTVEFKNVSFSFPDSDEKEKMLANINFSVKQGETVAIIGPTGSGKTTLINLIARFYDATEGEVLVDGINVKEYSEKELRKKVSIAAQKAVLFKGTIKENIALGCDQVDDEKIKKSLSIANADFVQENEKGVDAEVAQGGTNFSGGQKQRLSIARAIYKDAEIIVFDDTFSALDYKTDMMVRKEINDNLNNKTIIIVAQRIGTIKDADKIIVLDEGQIVGIGTHNQLLKDCKLYQEIALSQLSKEEL